MIDSPSAIDPLVAEGPRAAVDTLRPGLNFQRILFLDQPGPLMADLATGDIRRYESGPPVSLPMISDSFDLARLRRMQVQIGRDLRPSSVSQTLLSLDVESAACVVDVRISSENLLEIVASHGGVPPSAVHAGSSPAFVIVVEQASGEVEVSARNAETLDSISLSLSVADRSAAMVTVGGPSMRTTGQYGRRRSAPVLIDLEHHLEPVDRLRHVGRRARSVAGAARRRIG